MRSLAAARLKRFPAPGRRGRYPAGDEARGPEGGTGGGRRRRRSTPGGPRRSARRRASSDWQSDDDDEKTMPKQALAHAVRHRAVRHRPRHPRKTAENRHFRETAGSWASSPRRPRPGRPQRQHRAAGGSPPAPGRKNPPAPRTRAHRTPVRQRGRHIRPLNNSRWRAEANPWPREIPISGSLPQESFDGVPNVLSVEQKVDGFMPCSKCSSVPRIRIRSAGAWARTDEPAADPGTDRTHAISIS